MSEHIQPLLERIRTEGLKKAEAERDALLDQARAEAGRIREAAEAEAKALREAAEKDAESTKARGSAALDQAARDTLLKFRSELNRQVELAAKAAAGASMQSDELVSELLKDLIHTRGVSGKISVEADSETAKRLETLLPALLRDLGAGEGSDIVINPRAGKGFKLKFAESAAVVDVTDEAVADWLGTFLRPDLAKRLQPGKEG